MSTVPEREIRVVALGGGTGLPVLLRGLKRYTSQITAIVTVADDGGSSGRLQRSIGILPPGDFRNNIAALSESEETFQLLLQYRFGQKEGLEGHALGNLLITAMAAIFGNFESGIANSSRVFAVKGEVLPSTLESVTLCAEVVGHDAENAPSYALLRGESTIGVAPERILRVMLDPPNVKAFPRAVQAILQADLIVAGPGSFYTSTLPSLLIQGIRQAISAAQAPKIFVANILNQIGETSGFTLQDYLHELQQHQLQDFKHVLVNNRILTSGGWAQMEWIVANKLAQLSSFQLHSADLIDEKVPWRHDSGKLAILIWQLRELLNPQPSQASFD